MEWTVEQVRWSFSGRLIGSSFMQKVICQTMLCLPPEIIKYATSSVWFISSSSDAWAFTLKGSDVEGQFIIFLPNELFRQRHNKIRYTILHEIGHIILGHNNSMGYKQSLQEINRQEKAADKFAKKYLVKLTS